MNEQQFWCQCGEEQVEHAGDICVSCEEHERAMVEQELLRLSRLQRIVRAIRTRKVKS